MKQECDCCEAQGLWLNKYLSPLDRLNNLHLFLVLSFLFSFLLFFFFFPHSLIGSLKTRETPKWKLQRG